MKKIIYFYYFFSGFIALVLQVLWQRKLLLIFGGTVYSIAILLSIWMLGLALGSIIFYKISYKIKNPIYLFFSTQIIILIYALLLYGIFYLINCIDSIIFLLKNKTFSLFLKIILTFLALIIPTSLTGMSLPLLSLVTSKKEIPILYSINALGSVIGAFITGFIFLIFLGYNNTLFLIITIGFFLYLIGIIITKNFNFLKMQEVKDNNLNIDLLSKSAQKVFIILIPILFFLSGFSSLSYEILYNRILIYFTGNNVYCFTIITCIFIAGISLGSFYYFLVRKNIRSPIFILAILELIIGLWNIIFPKYSEIINTFIVWIKSVINLNFFLLILIRILSSALLILLPIFIFGFIFPLIIDIFISLKNSSKKEKEISILYFFNTIGSVLGPLITGFILIDIFQIYLTLRVVSLLNVFIFIVIALSYILTNNFNKYKSFWLTILFFLTLIVIFNFDSEITVSKLAAKTLKSDTILYYKEGVFGTVTVSKRYNGVLHLKINGIGEVPTDYNSIKVFKMLAYIPFIIKEDIKSVLTIAFGAGITYGSICNIQLENKINIEICKDVLNSAYLFSQWNHDVINKEKDTIQINDGRYFVEKSKQNFDLIVSDATHPIASDSWVLYTKEFYYHCKNRLNPSGIMLQWIPLHLLDWQNYKIILKTFSSVFKEVVLFIANEYSIIVGSDNPINLSEKAFNKILLNETVKKDLYSVNLSNFKDFYYSLVFTTNDIKNITSDAKIATDNFSPLQFAEISTINKDTRIDIIEKFIDLVNKNEKNEVKKEILTTIFQSNLYYFKKDYISQILFLSKKYDEHTYKKILTEELTYQYNITKQGVSYYFSIPQNIQKYLLNPTEENVKLIEQISNIIINDNNIELLKGILYYKIKRWEDALTVFINNHKKNKNPDTYRNIIRLLKKMNREKDAEIYLKEAKKEYGDKFDINY